MKDAMWRRVRTGPASLVRCLLALLMMALLADAAAAQQELVIRGRVLGPAGEGVAEQRVVLHRVDAAGGATVAETVSGVDGSYELRAPTSPADTAAVLFVAARYDGELYIGPPFRADEPGAEQQDIRVGIPELSASALMEQDGGLPMPMQRRTEQSRTWLLILIPLLGVAGVMVYALVPKSKIPHDRALLIRIAELDERMVDAPDAQRESLRDERTRLIAELRQG